MRELSNWWFGICGGYKSKESDVLIVIIFLLSLVRGKESWVLIRKKRARGEFIAK
jgi:hypothetical protein